MYYRETTSEVPVKISLLTVVTVVGTLLTAGCQQEPKSYADCLLSHAKPELSDRAVQLVKHACIAKFPDSFASTIKLELEMDEKRRASFDAGMAAAEQSANAAAEAAQRAANAAAAQTSGNPAH